MPKSADQVLLDTIFDAPIAESELAEQENRRRQEDAIEANDLVVRVLEDEALLAAVGGGRVRPALYYGVPVAVVITTNNKIFKAEPQFGYLSPIGEVDIQHLTMLAFAQP